MSFSDAVKFYILTNNSDTWGKIETAVIDALECTASILIPGMGEFLAVLNFYDLFYECVNNWDKTSFAKTAADISEDKLLDEVKKQMKKEGRTDTEIIDTIKSIRPHVKNLVCSLYTEDYKEALNDVALGIINAVCDKKKRELDKNVAAMETLSKEVEREMRERSVDVFGKMEGMEFLDLDSFIDNFKLSLVPIVYTFAFDWIANPDNSSNADPFGDYDVAIEEFRRAVKDQGFGSELADGVYGVAQKIFKDYYSITIKLQ